MRECRRHEQVVPESAHAYSLGAAVRTGEPTAVSGRKAYIRGWARRAVGKVFAGRCLLIACILTAGLTRRQIPSLTFKTQTCTHLNVHLERIVVFCKGILSNKWQIRIIKIHQIKYFQYFIYIICYCIKLKNYSLYWVISLWK